MDKAVKYLGGIGYLLVIIAPFFAVRPSIALVFDALAFVGILLVAIAWIMLGRELGDNVMLANGIMMILAPIVSVGLLFGVIFTMLPKTNYQPPTLPPNPMAFLKTLMIVVAIILVIGFVSWLLHVLSLLRAGNKLGKSPFRYAAYCQIASFVIGIIGLALMINGVLSVAPLLQTQLIHPSPMMLYRIFGTSFVVLMIGGFVGFVSYVLACVGFFSIE